MLNVEGCHAHVHVHAICMVIFMVNKSDVEICYINIYKLEPSSLSIRVTVPTSTGTFTQIPRRSLESESETD